MLVQGSVGEQTLYDGANGTFRQGRQGEQIVSELHGRFYTLAKSKRLFMAQAIVTAPVIYSTNTNTGGPLIWNPPTSGVDVVVLAVSFGITTVTTVAAALGLTGNSGQTSAPGSTTTIDGTGNMYFGGPASAATAYRIGTPTTGGSRLLPFGALHTGALTVDNSAVGFVDIGGAWIAPPGSWVSIAASATASTTVGTFGMIWEEIPLPI